MKRRSDSKVRYYKALKRRATRDFIMTGVLGIKDQRFTKNNKIYHRLHILEWGKTVDILNKPI